MRTTGRTSMGVRGMNLSYDDEVVGMQLDTQGEQLLLVSEYGLGKRTNIEEFGVQQDAIIILLFLIIRNYFSFCFIV